MRLSIDTSDARRMAADVRALGRQAQFANVVALTRTAVEVKAAEQEEMRSVFDRPTPFTLNAIYVKGATKSAPEAVVGIKDDNTVLSRVSTTPNRVLSAEIEGGNRALKRFEKSMQIAGYMPKGWFAVPGRFARLDGYGNLSRGQIIQILSQLRITLTAGYDRNLSFDPKKKARAVRRAGGQFFALPDGRGKLRPGIYQRRDSGLGSAAPRPVVIFVKRVAYRKLFDFHGVARRAAEVYYPAKLDEALAQYAP
jgi:hypothetical protein